MAILCTPFFSFENRDAMQEYLEEFPDLDIEPGFVIYYKGDTKKSFKMFHWNYLKKTYINFVIRLNQTNKFMK